VPEHIDPFERLRPVEPDDTTTALDRPQPGHPLVVRVRGGLEPWLAWFGLRRVVATAVTVVALVVVGWWLLRAPAPPTEAGLPFAAASTATSSPPSVPASRAGPSPPTSAAGTIVVHVAGAVAAPGVYELGAGARTADAVTVAGGASPEADVDALNLAAPLADGERVYVPAVGEAVPPPLGPPIDSVAAGPVDVNRATAGELDELPGVGPATALAIVAHREANGPFASVDDLEQVRGIGPAKLEAIRPLVTV
jgi:competence protein ComEA